MASAIATCLGIFSSRYSSKMQGIDSTQVHSFAGRLNPQTQIANFR